MMSLDEMVLTACLIVLVSFYALLVDRVWTDRRPYDWKHWRRKK